MTCLFLPKYHSVEAFVRAGLNPQKVVVLTSTIGYLYTLSYCFVEGQVNVISVEKLNKYRVQQALEQEKFYISWDDTRQVPYGTVSLGSSDKKWITFNDLESHRLKAKFVLKYQLGGIGAYTIDQEDERARSSAGGCQPGIPFPFLWTLVNTVRPQTSFVNPPLLIGEDYGVQYVPRPPYMNVAPTSLCGNETNTDSDALCNM